jgi:hypothetical protein
VYVLVCVVVYALRYQPRREIERDVRMKSCGVSRLRARTVLAPQRIKRDRSNAPTAFNSERLFASGHLPQNYFPQRHRQPTTMLTDVPRIEPLISLECSSAQPVNRTRTVSHSTYRVHLLNQVHLPIFVAEHSNFEEAYIGISGMNIRMRKTSVENVAKIK